MRKKLSAILSLIVGAVCCLFSFSGCGLRSCMGCMSIVALLASFEEVHEEDPAKYGEFSDYVELPTWFPESIEEYDVQGYSYRLLAYMDICYEVYVDVIMSETQLEETLRAAIDARGLRFERDAYYADGFYEFVFEDEYMTYETNEDGEKCVGWATVEKIVYNPTTCEVIFECFRAHDTGVYPLEDVAYFNRFNIEEEEYILYTVTP